MSKEILRTGKIYKRAFTLVELLVVISIIALLLAMLMPALRRARDKANQVKCLASMKSIGYGEQMYAADNREYFPNPNCPGLGGSWGFRAGPGYKDPLDPRGLYERYGLAAVLGQVDYYGKSPKGAYIDGHSKLWVCNAQPKWMKNLGNTFAYNPGTTLNKKSYDFKEPCNTALAWDDTNWLPYTPGIPLTGSTSKFTVDPKQIVFPHRFANQTVGAINYLFADLRVAQFYQR